ncbi:MAG: ATP-binding protein [Acidobacteria bacterium]|nr:ATP-binding protein [Acidobacteriota bacterium]
MEHAPLSAGSVINLLARSDQLTDVVAALRDRAAAATGATMTVLLELDARSGQLHQAADPTDDEQHQHTWFDEEDDAALVADVLSSGRVRQVALNSRTAPELARRLGTAAVVLAPVIHAGQPLGLLVLGLPAAVPAIEWSDRVVECAEAIGLTLVRARMRHEASLQHDLQGLLVELGRSGTPTIPLDRFENFCTDVARAMDAERVDLWLHDRLGRKIDRMVSSDRLVPGDVVCVLTSDTEHVVAETLRQPCARFVGAPPDGGTGAATVAVPLEGRRRALGVLLIEGLSVHPGDVQQTLDLVEGLGHQLANVIESTQLLDDVLRTRRELENTFDSMRDHVFVCGHDGRVSHVNQAVVRRLNRLRGELVGHPISAMVGPSFAEWLATPDDGEGEQRPARTAEIEDAVLGGTFLVTVTPLADKNPSLLGSVVVARDVSEERRLGAERAALRERLARSEAMGHLVAGIAHELNNPLQAVLGHVELLQRSHRFSAMVSSGLRLVYRESDRAARIVRNLLVLAGSGHVVQRPVSVNAALRRALALRASACRRAKITVVRRLSESVPKVAGDAVLLQQAFLNLILNAEQALEGRAGRIEVRSSYSASRKLVAVEVKDSGSGIAPDVLPRVFDPFFTTKDVGSGLGLTMTLRIIREHGGDVVAAPRGSGGAVFTVHLPAAPSSKR